MSKRTPQLLLEDILEAAKKILDYTDGLSLNDFTNDSKTIDAVCRNFEIIGEAANRLPEEFRNQNENIDWYRIRGFRNRIIHEYFGVDRAGIIYYWDRSGTNKSNFFYPFFTIIGIAVFAIIIINPSKFNSSII